MADIEQMRRLALTVSGWNNLNRAWLDRSEDNCVAVVGHINEDGEAFPVIAVDCDQYDCGDQSLPLAKFYAAVNPAAITDLLDRIEAVEKERDAAELMSLALRAKIERMEHQKPVGEIQRANSTGNYICSEVWVPLPVGSKLYALPGAQTQGELK